MAQVGEEKFTSFDNALTAALAAEDHTLTLLQDVTKDISITAGSTLTIEGSGKTLYGTINCVAASGEHADQTNTNLTLNNLTVDGDTGRNGTADKSILITSQNQSATVVSGLNPDHDQLHRAKLQGRSERWTGHVSDQREKPDH